MSDRPIMFCASMVRAILDGTKTQTRRLARRELGASRSVPTAWRDIQAGDCLWVREAIAASGAYVQYVADLKATRMIWPGHWKSSFRTAIHMPRTMCRINLVVTATRVEHLQDITEEGAKAEGMRPIGIETGRVLESGNPVEIPSYRAAFADLWGALHGPSSWGANPEVVVICFSSANACWG